MTPPSVALRRLVYRTGHRVLRVWWQLGGSRAQGVKCVVRHGSDVVFVRHTYGDRDAWELPGGGIRRGEAPRDAAAREAREELGVDLADWRPLGSFQARGYGRLVTISCFEARPATRALELDLGEIAEARWAPVWAPPHPAGKDVGAVLRRAVPGVSPPAAPGDR